MCWNRYVTFLCGQPGIYALGAAAAKCRGDQQRLDRYLGLFNEVIFLQAPMSVPPVESPMLGTLCNTHNTLTLLLQSQPGRVAGNLVSGGLSAIGCIGKS